MFAHTRPSLFNCKNEYLVLALGKESAIQAVVWPIVWAFRKARKAKESEDERLRLRAS